jgi:hypothetical protein
MSGITTIGRWIWLPTPGGGDDRLAADLPLGAGLMATLASNACHAARENGLRPLWEHPGAEVFRGLYFGNDPGNGAFPWRGIGAVGAETTPPLLLTGLLAVHAGVYRVRRYGETRQWPTIRLQARCLSSSVAFNTGIVVVAVAMGGDPSTGRAAFATTTSTTFVDLTADLELRDSDLFTGNISPDPDGDESGSMPTVALYVGAWNDSDGVGGAKGNTSSLSLFMVEP